MDADRMRMTQQNIPAGQSIENQPTVNIICYENDGMSEFLFFFPDQNPQLIQGLLRIITPVGLFGVFMMIIFVFGF